MASKIDPLYLALLHQRHHDFEKCADVCTKGPYLNDVCNVFGFLDPLQL